MWSEHTAVQVVSWRMLSRLFCGLQELIDQMYLDEDTLATHKQRRREEDENKVTHRDSNGVILEVGDSVVLIKDLKGLEYSRKTGNCST
jgi:protein PhnA